MSKGPARTLAAAGTAGAGAAVAAAAYLIVGGHSGMLYAAGICAATFLGVLAIVSSRATEAEPDPGTALDVAAPRQPRWRRKSHVIAELRVELAETAKELEEHRQALANLATQLSRESEAARLNAQGLERRIRDTEGERDALQELVARERERFDQTLEELGGGIGGHANELAQLERELAALIAR
ncbi:MAG TPA: hypothetical protein VE220_06790 [Gaiellaceae bacterium]|nr:hypothetical protein [Gaiellaceae bacterium]